MSVARRTRRALVLTAVAGVMLFALAGPAVADTVNFSGSLTAATATFQRPGDNTPADATACTKDTSFTNSSDTGGTTYHYAAQAFTVGTTGTYDILNVSNTFPSTDSYFALYAGSFDPANPFTNLAYANDDTASTTQSEIDCTLNAGTLYILVTTTWSANATGDFANRISGPGTVTLGAVAATIRSLSASRARLGVVVRWRTASEVDVAGFNVYREVRGTRVRVNRHVIAAHGAGSYSFLDRHARTGVFWVQLVNLDGSRRWYGPARVGTTA